MRIPEYQRPYSWEEKQLKALLDGIKEHNDSTTQSDLPYYLGNLVLHQKENDVGGTYLDIVDGQQRTIYTYEDLAAYSLIALILLSFAPYSDQSLSRHR